MARRKQSTHVTQCIHRAVLKGIEQLEPRTVLAATADIVFVVDESESALVNQQTNVGVLHQWVADLAEQLDQKLVQRGITNNR